MAQRSSKKKSAKRERKERRFLPSQISMSTFGFWAGIIGSLVLGAGVYAVWIADPAMAYGQLLAGTGAAVFTLAVVFGDTKASPVRMGDAGLALERGSEITRIPWCDLKRISVANGRTIAEAQDGGAVELPLRAHAVATAWLLAEAIRRVPEVMDVKPSVVDSLPKPDPKDGELVPVAAVQVVGRHCAASDEPISFERDARLCSRCAQVYHRDHVPRKCQTCGAELGDAAISL